MTKFSWKKKKVNGKDVFQVLISNHPHGNPCNSEEDANATIVRLEQEELQREIDRNKSTGQPEEPQSEPKPKRKTELDDSFQP